LTLIYTFEINTGAKSDEAVRNEDAERMLKLKQNFFNLMLQRVTVKNKR